MADNTLKTRLLSAYNTLDFWDTCTTIPLGGEVCYAVDDNNEIIEIKIGDGIRKYSELPAQSFDSTDHLYKLSTPVSTTTAVDKFTATTYLQVNDGAGGSSYSNSSSAVLTIPTATATAAGLLSKDDKVKLNGIATGANKVEVVEGTTNGTIKVTTNGTASTVKVHGLDSAAYTSSTSYLTDIAKSGNSITKTKGGSTSTVVTFGDAAFKSTTGSITSGSALPTEGAVKTYVDGLVANATHFCGGFTASGDGAIDGQTGKTLKTEAEKVGDMYVVTTAGTFCGIAFEIGDSIIFKKVVAAGTAVAATDFIAVEATVSVTNNGPTLSWGNTSTVGSVEGTFLTVKMPSNPNTDTKVTAVGNHYTPSSSGTFSPVAGGTTTNISDTVINYIAGLQKDAAGHITGVVSSSIKADKNTDTKVTSVGNHYTPSSSGTYTASASGAAAAWGIDVVKGITLYKDAAGHITNVSVESGKIPANPNTNYYTTALNSGTTSDGYYIKVEGNNAAVKGTAVIPTYTTASTSANGVLGLVPTPSSGSANRYLNSNKGWAQPAFSDLSGNIGTAQLPNSGVSAGTYGDSTHVPKVTVDAKGRVTSATTVAIPSATSAAEGLTKKPTGIAPINVSTDNVISHDNSGVTAGVYGAAQTASFNGNVAIPSVKIDAKGHVTTAGTVNVKMPSTAGLGTSAKDVKSVLFKANTNGNNNDLGVVLTFNDNTTTSSIITSTLILNGNFTV